jgi:hypothetical protein
MKLIELDAHFVKLEMLPQDEHFPNGRPSFRRVELLSEADGVWFLCPKCFATNQGKVGTHSVLCFFEGRVPDWVQPNPGRWNPVGTGLNDLTFVPGKKTQSVQLLGGCNWHGFVTNGSAE